MAADGYTIDGPQDRTSRTGSLPFNAEVECAYLDKKLNGKSPKFACMRGIDDELKVKFGGTNGEVYAEVAATRLLWALGFSADHMYSVKVICHECPAAFGGILLENGDRVFDPGSIERKMPGAVLSENGHGGTSTRSTRSRAAPR